MMVASGEQRSSSASLLPRSGHRTRRYACEALGPAVTLVRLCRRSDVEHAGTAMPQLASLPCLFVAKCVLTFLEVFFETGSPVAQLALLLLCVAEAGPKFLLFLSPRPKCQGYRGVPPACFCILKKSVWRRLVLTPKPIFTPLPLTTQGLPVFPLGTFKFLPVW